MHETITTAAQGNGKGKGQCNDEDEDNGKMDNPPNKITIIIIIAV